jgi:ElaB/YqjD/DUF883 family membrane-anchored ribosome-binding protein
MDQTLHELQQRLSPRNVWHDVMAMFRSKREKSAVAHEQHRTHGAADTTKDAAKQVGRRVLKVMRDHPVPTVLATTALTTLIYESAAKRKLQRARNIRSINIYRGEPTMYGGSHVHAQSGEPYTSRNVPGQQQFQYESDAPGAMHKAGQKISEMKSQASEKMSQAGESVRSGMQNTREFIEERPLTVGVGALALGVLVGLLIPRTRREDELMGEQSAAFINRTKAMGEDVVERGKHGAEEAMEAAAEAASEESEKQGLKPE